VGLDIPLRVHARVLQPLLDMALVMLGIPLVAGPARRGIFVAVGMCVAMTVLFFITVLGSHALALGEAWTASLGAWIPLLTLAPLAAWRAQPMWQ
jgi:lipopolysaccharide export system permease protein